MTVLDPDRTGLPRVSLTPEPLVRTRSEDGVLVVTYGRDCLDDPWARDLREICLGYAEDDGGGWRYQAVSLGLAHGVTCAGLRSLVEISDGLAARGGGLAVFGVGDDVRAVIRRTGLVGRLLIARGAHDAVSLVLGGRGDRTLPFSLGGGLGIFRAAS